MPISQNFLAWDSDRREGLHGWESGNGGLAYVARSTAPTKVTCSFPLSRSLVGVVGDGPALAARESGTSAPLAGLRSPAPSPPRLGTLGATPRAEFQLLCEAPGVDSPYIVVQATPGLDGFVRFIKNHAEQ